MSEWKPVAEPPQVRPWDLILLGFAGSVWPGFYDHEEGEWSVLPPPPTET